MAKWLSLGAGGLTAGLGIGGIAQSLMGGGRQTSSTVTPSPLPPEAQALLQMAMQQAAGPGGAMQGFQARRPGEEAAYGQGLQQLRGLGTQAADLSRLLHPQLTRQFGQLGQLQAEALQGAVPDQATQAMLGSQAGLLARGGLPALSPELKQMLDQIYQGREQDISRSVDRAMMDAIERGRQQGFAGGLDILQGPTGALMAPALAEAVRQRAGLMGARTQDELQLAQQLPFLGAQLEQARLQPNLGLAGAASTPLALRLQGMYQGFSPQFQAAGGLMGAGQQGAMNQIELIRALGGLGATFGAGRGQTTTQMGPSPTLLDAFAPTASLLGGTGGLLTALGSMK